MATRNNVGAQKPKKAVEKTLHGIPCAYSMDIHGIARAILHGYSMEFHGYPWKSMDTYGNVDNKKPLGNGISMECPWNIHGTPWISMDIHQFRLRLTLLLPTI